MDIHVYPHPSRFGCTTRTHSDIGRQVATPMVSYYAHAFHTRLNTWEQHPCTRNHGYIHTYTGGKPLLALAIVCMPLDKLPQDKIAKILEGGQSVCADAGIPVAGGHTIDGLECIYGLVVIGLVGLA
jgi:hypothetical protein